MLLLLQGIIAQNRAVDGDVVIIRILPQTFWFTFRRDMKKATQKSAAAAGGLSIKCLQCAMTAAGGNSWLPLGSVSWSWKG